MLKSRQRLGDDPRDYDGVFFDIDDKAADTSCIRPDADFKNLPKNGQQLGKWNIYPRPPPPHWHWKKNHAVSGDEQYQQGDRFDFEQCEIPGPMEDWSFQLDPKGVYQVYEPSAEGKPAFDIPDIREYFMDLEYVLSVIADGPTKSLAYRRLKYLSSKFTMYSLLNEFQEMADMKVCIPSSALPSHSLSYLREYPIAIFTTSERSTRISTILPA